MGNFELFSENAEFNSLKFAVEGREFLGLALSGRDEDLEFFKEFLEDENYRYEVEEGLVQAFFDWDFTGYTDVFMSIEELEDILVGYLDVFLEGIEGYFKS